MNTKEAFENMLFPQGIKCIVCDAELAETPNNGLCGKCFLPRNTSFCPRCGRASKVTGGFCLECQSIDWPVDAARAPFIYDGAAKQLVRSLKFGNRRYLAAHMAEYMADAFKESGLFADLITFVPMFWRKQKERGYNQAGLLAVETAKILGIPCLNVLDRIKGAKHTAKLRRFQRKEIIRDSVDVIPGVIFRDKTILLIDDVFTTGTTAAECAKKLKNSGAAKINVLTFATSRIIN